MHRVSDEPTVVADEGRTLQVAWPWAGLLVSIPVLLVAGVIAFLAYVTAPTVDPEFEFVEASVDPSLDPRGCWGVGNGQRPDDAHGVEVAVEARRRAPAGIRFEIQEFNAHGYVRQVEIELTLDPGGHPTARVRAHSRAVNGSGAWPVSGLKGTVRVNDVRLLQGDSGAGIPLACSYDLRGMCAGSDVAVRGSAVIFPEELR